MDFRIHFSHQALSDLRELVEFIQQDSPAAASRISSALLNYIELLSGLPELGRRLARRAHVRALVQGPYVIYYRLERRRRRVVVLHIWHGARGKPKLLS